MNQRKQLTIKDFAHLTGIKRENLRFYDRIGLLCPEMRGQNNYRYYSRRQLNTAYLISTLRGLGVGIEDIKKYAACRTPASTLSLLSQQDARIQAEIRHLEETRRVMQVLSDMMREGLAHGENALFLEEKEREPVFLCPPIPDGMNGEEGEIFSYDYAEANGVNPGFPFGILVEREKLSSVNTSIGGTYYFKVGSGGNAYKPAGLYAVAYGKSDSWTTDAIYARLKAFIQEQGLRICGDAYEEYPYGSIELQEPEQYLVRVEIPVSACV